MSSPVRVPAGRSPSRWPLGLAAGTLVLEALGIGIFGVLVLSRLPGTDVAVVLGSGVLFLAYGALLLAVGRAVLRGRRWARGPAVATQLLHLLIAWSYRHGPTTDYAVGAAVAAGTVLVCLLLPVSTAIFEEEPAPRGDPPRG